MKNHLPQPGQIARVRQRLYLVEHVKKGKRVKDATLVSLSCVDDDAQGQPLEALWENELDAEIVSGEQWDSIAQRGLDDAKLFSAYLNTLKWNCVTSTDPKLFQSPFRAGIRLDAYQLEPLRKALRLPRVNLFIADDVGLGKTIEAGLIARELLLRKRAKEIVVSAPPSMLLQWKEELENRFGLTFEIFDKDYVRKVRQERGFGVNPWTTHSRFLISHRLLIDENYVGPLRDWLGTFKSGAMLILDEAHHAAPASGAKYAIDSKITRAVEDFAKRFEHRLFLSATPHNGHSNSFSRLLELLDPQRFCRGVEVSAKHRDDVIVRRLKEDIREVVGGGFPNRNVVQVDIDGLPSDAPELKLAELLSQYADKRETRLSKESKSKQAASGLLITGLQQRLLSSVEAFARTLKVHRKTAVRQWEASEVATTIRRTPVDSNESKESQTALVAESSPGYSVDRQPSRSLDLLAGSVGSDDERATMTEEQLQQEEDAQIQAASTASSFSTEDAEGRELWAEEQKLLDQMTAIAEDARHKTDARVKKLIEWIKKTMCPDLGKKDAEWNDERVLIFTEYDDTKRYLVTQLELAIEKSELADHRIQIFHGPTPIEKREEIKRAFNTPPNKHPVRILVATDAAREGLNLQAHCSNLFHFDVPWNPSRMEQRNGRIDRKLQPKEDVYCHYFVYKQRPEDRILQVLVRKTATIKEELGSLSQVIDHRLTKTLKKGIRRRNIDSMETDIEQADLDAELKATVLEELEASRERQDELRVQVDRLRDILQKSKKSIGLNDELFESAVSSSLQILGADPLIELDTQSGPEQNTFPALDEKIADWADTMDSLRAPRKRGQKKWEWRKESPIRPIVFSDPGIIDDSVVHLHLEHRVVQRLLGRFISQGFVHNDLSRACFSQTKDGVPRVILLGRLALYGPGAARLHEELVPVTARWKDPKIRDSELQPYARDAETKTLSLLDDAFQNHTSKTVDPKVTAQLQESAVLDIEQLLPHLQERGESFAIDAKAKLAKRAEAEAKAMKEILETQRTHINTKIKQHAKPEKDRDQTKFEFAVEDPEEKRQLSANKRFWAKRLELLKDELKTEPDRIRDLYDVKATRIEPVGLVYLWPATG